MYMVFQECIIRTTNVSSIFSTDKCYSTLYENYDKKETKLTQNTFFAAFNLLQYTQR